MSVKITIDDGVAIIHINDQTITICADTAVVNCALSGMPAVKVPLSYKAIEEAIAARRAAPQEKQAGE